MRQLSNKEIRKKLLALEASLVALQERLGEAEAELLEDRTLEERVEDLETKAEGSESQD